MLLYICVYSTSLLFYSLHVFSITVQWLWISALIQMNKFIRTENNNLKYLKCTTLSSWNLIIILGLVMRNSISLRWWGVKLLTLAWAAIVRLTVQGDIIIQSIWFNPNSAPLNENFLTIPDSLWTFRNPASITMSPALIGLTIY